MDQHQGVYLAQRYQVRSNCSFAKGCGSTKDTFIASSQSLCRLYLRWPAVAVEIKLDGNPAEPMIRNFDCDAMAIKQIKYFFQQPTRQRNVMTQILSARDDSRFAESRKPHRLGSIELRVLKCSQSHQAIQKHIGQIFLLDVNQISKCD